MKPLSLNRTYQLRVLLAAELSTDASDHDAARSSASFVALSLLEMLGLSERECEVVRCMVVAVESGGVSDYEAAHGVLIAESLQEAESLFGHLSDLREDVA